MAKKKRLLKLGLGILCSSLFIFTYFFWQVYQSSKIYYEDQCDAAIVLGASVINGEPSAVFKERLNHAHKLWKDKRVQFILLTGGIGERSLIAESVEAKHYLMKKGVPDSVLFTEQMSKNTEENIIEAKKAVDQNKWGTVLLVSDPIHMKRAIWYARVYELKALTSPTQTSMYRTAGSRFKFMISETFFLIYAKLSSW